MKGEVGGGVKRGRLQVRWTRQAARVEIRLQCVRRLPRCKGVEITIRGELVVNGVWVLRVEVVGGRRLRVVGEWREGRVRLLDDVGVKLASPLIQAAKRGVEVAALLLRLQAALIEGVIGRQFLLANTLQLLHVRPALEHHLLHVLQVFPRPLEDFRFVHFARFLRHNAEGHSRQRGR
jgi:hypothetical protein